MMQQTGTQAEYARHLGVSRQAVGKRYRNGQLVMVGGKVDFEASDRLFERTADPSKAGLPDELVEALERHGIEVDDDGDDAASEVGGTTYAREKTRDKMHQANLRELEFLRRSGELVPKADVEDALVEAGRMIRLALDGLEYLAEEIAAEAISGGAPAVRARLRQQAREIQNQAADRLQDLRFGEQAGRDDDEHDDDQDQTEQQD